MVFVGATRYRVPWDFVPRAARRRGRSSTSQAGFSCAASNGHGHDGNLLVDSPATATTSGGRCATRSSTCSSSTLADLADPRSATNRHLTVARRRRRASTMTPVGRGARAARALDAWRASIRRRDLPRRSWPVLVTAAVFAGWILVSGSDQRLEQRSSQRGSSIEIGVLDALCRLRARQRRPRLWLVVLALRCDEPGAADVWAVKELPASTSVPDSARSSGSTTSQPSRR